MDMAYNIVIFWLKKNQIMLFAIKLIFNSYFSKRECQPRPSERWFMLKDLNSSYFVQRHSNIL